MKYENDSVSFKLISDILSTRYVYNSYMPIMLDSSTLIISCHFYYVAYLMTEAGLGKRSLRVKCFVCEKEWFQTTERLLKTNNQHHLQNMSDSKIAEIRTQQQMSWQQTRQTTRLDKVGVFVGNLPYTFDEVRYSHQFIDEYVLPNMYQFSSVFIFLKTLQPCIYFRFTERNHGFIR